MGAAFFIVAHQGHAHGAPAITAERFWDIATAVTKSTTAVLYVRGLSRLWLSEGGRLTVRRWQAAAFAAGWVTVVIALLSPLARLSDILFSAHMAQHEVLMLICAPLMVIGRPFIVMMWALGAAARARIGLEIRRPTVLAIWSRLTGPFTVLILHAIVLWVWHVPVLFEAALENETVHVFQHLGFFLTAAIFWWALIHGRYGRVGYGVGVLYVFATAMHTQILGALLTFGQRVWYPTHAARTGANALEDQQLAGIVMWVPFGLIFVIIALALFAAWLGEIERRVKLNESGAKIAALMVVCALFFNCSGSDERTAVQMTGGNVKRGRAAIQRHGCGACHSIAGVQGANGLVGPPLTGIADRAYLAGRLANQPDNMLLWIMDPQKIDSQTAMPDLGLSERDARDIAAYLYTLRVN
jgi:putative membrane protein